MKLLYILLVLIACLTYVGCGSRSANDDVEVLVYEDTNEEPPLTTYEIEDEQRIISITGDQVVTIYEADYKLTQIDTYDNQLYMLEAGDLSCYNLEDGSHDMVLDYSGLRGQNHPAPTEINKFIIEDDWIYCMYTLDIYTYIFRVDLKGKNKKLLYSWYDKHYVTDILGIEGKYIIFEYTDIWVSDAPTYVARIIKDGSGYRPKNDFIDFLN